LRTSTRNLWMTALFSDSDMLPFSSRTTFAISRFRGPQRLKPPMMLDVAGRLKAAPFKAGQNQIQSRLNQIQSRTESDSKQN
jgi:hypothetical protein